jgi:hypothetical protein
MQLVSWPQSDLGGDEIASALAEPGVAPLWEAESLEQKLVVLPAWKEYTSFSRLLVRKREGVRGARALHAPVRVELI